MKSQTLIAFFSFILFNSLRFTPAYPTRNTLGKEISLMQVPSAVPADVWQSTNSKTPGAESRLLWLAAGPDAWGWFRENSRLELELNQRVKKNKRLETRRVGQATTLPLLIHRWWASGPSKQTRLGDYVAKCSGVNG